ncbi:MAG TPA: hypothetical protein VHO70_20235 [Chitinispirillaceae bacterium]|nr:hypothetical protein [Chitinispirillaceae bacterium]
MATILDTSKTPPIHTLIQNDVDWFKYTVKPGIILKISGKGTNFLPVLSCKGKNDTLFHGDSFPSFLYAEDTTVNEFYIKIGPLTEKIIRAHENDSLTFNYSLKMEPTYNDLYEPDNTLKTASAAALNGTTQSRILLYKEKDYIKLDAVKDSSYKITLNNILRVSLLDSSGSEFYNRSWSNATTSNSFNWTCLETGSYYVKIDSSSQKWKILDSLKINYKVSFMSVHGDEYEPDNTPETATLIKVDTARQHHKLFVMDVDWVKFTGVKGIGYQFFCEQQFSISPYVNMSLYRNDGKTLYQNSMASGTVWNCPTDGEYYVKFWIDTKAAVNTSEWEYETYLQQVSLPVVSKEEIRNNAQTGYFLVKQSLSVSGSSQTWLQTAMQNDNLYQVCVRSFSPFSCTFFGNDLSTEIIPMCAITRNIGGEIVQVFVLKPQTTETHYIALSNTLPNTLSISYFITPFNNDAFEPDTLLNQLHTVSKDSIPIYRTLSINDTSDAVLFHGVDGKIYKLGITSDSVIFKVKTPSTTGAKLTLLESSPGQMRLSCSGTGDFVVNFMPSGFSERILSYIFYVKEE